MEATLKIKVNLKKFGKKQKHSTPKTSTFLLILIVFSISHLPLSLQTALHLAVITEQSEVVASLVRGGCDPQLVDDSGNTALHIACRKGSVTCFSVLTQACSSSQLNAMLNTLNYSGEQQQPNTSYHYAQGIFCVNSTQGVGANALLNCGLYPIEVAEGLNSRTPTSTKQ